MVGDSWKAGKELSLVEAAKMIEQEGEMILMLEVEKQGEGLVEVKMIQVLEEEETQ